MSAADLEDVARRAVEAATSAGATDAEAWSEGSRSREVRVHAGEVESLTEASGRGVGIRAWIGTRTGYAYGTDLSESGLAELAEAAAGAARVADEDENSVAPDPSGKPPEIDGLRDPAVAATETADVIELAKRIERVALDRDERVTGVEEVVYVDEDGDAAIATSRGVSGSFGSSVAYSFLQAMATQDSEVQTGLGFGVGRSPGALDPEEIGAEAGDEAASMLGASKPESRTCPVVLSERVTASFAGFIGGAVSADDVQRGRSPFADRLGDELASPAYVLADDGIDPGGLASAPFDGEGTPRERTPLIAEGKLLAYLHDSYTARRGGARSTGNAARSSYRSAPSVSPSNLVLESGRAHPRTAARADRRRRLHHGGRGPPLWRQPRHGPLLGGRVRTGDPWRRARRAAARVHDRRRPARHPGGRSGRGLGDPLGPVRRIGEDGAHAGRRDGHRWELILVQQPLLGSRRTPMTRRR